MAGPSAQPRVGLDPSRFKGCSSISKYEVICKLGEGTFGEVHKAKSRPTGEVFALKKILMHNEKDGFPVTAVREIKLLKRLSHINVLRLEDMAVERPKIGKEKKKAIMYMVTPYMDHDLSGLLENPDAHFTEPQIKCYMLQLLEGLRYIHDSNILHRDMKAANLLINNRGILQIADFGLARHYDEPPPRPGRGGGEARREYTTLVVTRWYRPPELLLQLRKYTTAIDLWGVGCVFGEMFKRQPILAGKSDLHQIQIIFDLVGSPTEESMPGWSSLPGCDGVKSFNPRVGNLPQVFRDQGSSAISLLTELLRLDWRKRLTAVDALQHPYFRNHPLPAKPGDLPRYEDSHELDRRKFRGQKAALPPAPAGGSVGMGPNGEWAGGSGPPNGGAYSSGPPSRDNRPAGPGLPRPPLGGPVPQQRPPPANPLASRPAWEREQRHPIPNRPPPPQTRPPDLPQGGPRPPQGNRSNVDTYIPSYAHTGAITQRGGPPPPRDDRRPVSRDDRDRGYRERDRDRDRDGPRDAPHRDRDRDVRHDRDRREHERDRDRGDRRPPPLHNDRGSDRSNVHHHAEERDDDALRRDRDQPRRTRSRSPSVERRRERERDIYRR